MKLWIKGLAIAMIATLAGCSIPDGGDAARTVAALTAQARAFLVRKVMRTKAIEWIKKHPTAEPIIPECLDQEHSWRLIYVDVSQWDTVLNSALPIATLELFIPCIENGGTYEECGAEIGSAMAAMAYDRAVERNKIQGKTTEDWFKCQWRWMWATDPKGEKSQVDPKAVDETKVTDEDIVNEMFSTNGVDMPVPLFMVGEEVATVCGPAGLNCPLNPLSPIFGQPTSPPPGGDK